MGSLQLKGCTGVKKQFVGLGCVRIAERRSRLCIVWFLPQTHSELSQTEHARDHSVISRTFVREMKSIVGRKRQIQSITIFLGMWVCRIFMTRIVLFHLTVALSSIVSISLPQNNFLIFFIVCCLFLFCYYNNISAFLAIWNNGD